MAGPLDRRWIVQAEDPPQLGDLLERMGVDAERLHQGCVFIDRQRATRADQRLEAGMEVRVFVPDAGGRVRLLHQRGGLIFAHKPAGIATQPDHRGSTDCFLAQLAELVGVPQDTLHAMSRLDRPVSGVILVAADRAARALAERARERGALRRRYVAIGHGAIDHGGIHRTAPGDSAASEGPSTGVIGIWREPIGKGRRPGLRAVQGRDSQPATTRFRVHATQAGACLLQLEPVTGRTHQLRVHAAHHGAPLLGDADYDGPRHLVGADGAVTPIDRIALHALVVEIHLGPEGASRPEQGWRVVSPAEESLVLPWQQLGGSPEDFGAMVGLPWLAEAAPDPEP